MGQKPWFASKKRQEKKNGKGKPRKLTFKWLNYLSAGLYNTVVYLSKLASEQPKKFSVSFPNKYNLYTNKWSDNFGNHLKSGQEPKRWPCSSQNVKDIIDDFVCLANLPPANHFIFKIHKSLGLKYYQFFIFWNLKLKGLTVFFTKLQITVKDYLPSCTCMYVSLLWITPSSDAHTDNLCCQDFEGKNNTLNKKIGGFPENDWNIAFVIFYTLSCCVLGSVLQNGKIYIWELKGKKHPCQADVGKLPAETKLWC